MHITCTNPKCRTRFESQFFNFRNSDVTLSNNRESCPKCGAMVGLPDGHFKFDNLGRATLIKELKSLNLSNNEVTKLFAVAELAKNEVISLDEFKVEITKISSRLSFLFPYFSSGNFVAFIGVLLFVLAAFKPLKDRLSTSGLQSLNRQSEKMERVRITRKVDSIQDSSRINYRRVQRQWAEQHRRNNGR